tara:strand:+ start:67 stop:312 length:246 start_codon:yes stop_codon:yes gene_type:complete
VWLSPAIKRGLIPSRDIKGISHNNNPASNNKSSTPLSRLLKKAYTIGMKTTGTYDSLIPNNKPNKNKPICVLSLFLENKIK